MANSFSDIQMMKNGVTPEALVTMLIEKIQNHDLTAIGITFVDKDGSCQFGTWYDDKKANRLTINGACNLLARFSEGCVLEDME